MLLGSPVITVEQEEHTQSAHITLHSELCQPHWQRMHDEIAVFYCVESNALPKEYEWFPSDCVQALHLPFGNTLLFGMFRTHPAFK